ncbi:MAG: biosynthetic-type acetolactate synthase large subunit [Ignavibacteria bacterium]|nr:biosynthetic-type acetolactate synthase large subunit [Ignavibacteria bacterium]MBI3766126.1 biosynthetic-type acetolactate synthase large subunit [Ignavibacteriales bacterium]
MTTTSEKLMTGSEIFVQCLIAEGVDVVFGYPGGANIGIYDALHDAVAIKHVLVRHEQGATHAAEGYAKATGKPGVVLVTSGPGATNTVTGIADAFMDSIPIVVFTGQVPLKLIGNDAFQEADIVGITRPITKHNYLVRDIRELAKTIKEAFYIATTGRPGPVLVDLPKDIMAQKTTFEYPQHVELRSYKPIVDVDIMQIMKAVKLINEAKRPVLYVGGGAIQSNASAELKALAEKMQCPVTTTLHGLGSFPEDNPLSMGMLGMHGTWYSNIAVSMCDVLIAVGARFDDRVTGNVNAFASNAKKIHIDIDPACISKNVVADAPIVGDVKNVLTKLMDLVHRVDTHDWLATIEQWKKEHPLRYTHGKEIRSQYVIHKLGEITKGNAILVTDVGQHQMWTAQFFNWIHPRSHITSGGLGTMGFSLPAAMGAAFGRKDLSVISISGDGGIQMNIQELATIVEHKLPLKIFVINNGFLGMVRQWQELFYERRYSQVALRNPDFVKLAEAYGCRAYKVTESSEVEGVVRNAMAYNDGPVFVEFVVAQEDNVFPMMPSGQTVNEMIDTPDPVNKNGQPDHKGLSILEKG